MKIAIHQNDNSFSANWIRYCKNNNIEYKIVNAYDSNIVKELEDCDAFMWHHHHGNPKDILFAKQLLASLQVSGKKVFPDINTGWHFDDKVGQKYLLESIKAPLVPSYVFYSKKDAIEWTKKVNFPKVFKLRGGAGAVNVKLVNDKREAVKLINKAFGKGFKASNIWNELKDRFSNFKKGKASFIHVLKGLFKCLIGSRFNFQVNREKGYAYFQEFIPGNSYDIRICVVGGRAFGLKRYTREKDFRASGSGNISYKKNEIDERCVSLSLDVAKRLGAQSIALDYIFDKNNAPLIVEISYGYSVSAYYECEGYWTEDMQWHAGENFDFCGWMVENLIKEVGNINYSKK